MIGCSNRLRIIVVACGTLVLTSCGNIPLGKIVAQPGKTQDQMQSDILYCKDQATLAANTADRQIEEFLLGATIIGNPIAHSMDAQTQRSAFANCMNSKGYNVLPPDGELAIKQSEVRGSENVVAPSPAQGAKIVAVDLPSGFESRPITDAIRADGAVYYAINTTADVGVLLLVQPHAGIIDMPAIALARRAFQMNQLTDSSSTDVSQLIVRGRPAYRYEATGITSNIRISYLVTIIGGSDQIVTLSCWTSAANFEKMKPMMSGLAEHVSGIR